MKVVEFPKTDSDELTPDVVLREALGRLEEVVIVGRPKKGGGLYVAMSGEFLGDDRAMAVWYLEMGKAALVMQGMEELVDGAD